MEENETGQIGTRFRIWMRRQKLKEHRALAICRRGRGRLERSIATKPFPQSFSKPIPRRDWTGRTSILRLHLSKKFKTMGIEKNAFIYSQRAAGATAYR